MIRWTRHEDGTKGTTEAAQSHHGLVLKAFWKTVRIMWSVWESHPHALVWDEEGQKPRLLDIHRTHGGLVGLPEGRGIYYTGNAEADATPEAQAGYEAYEAEQAAERRALEDARAKRLMEAEAREPRKGRWVKIAKGRKYPKGLEGFCFWTGGGKWGPRAGVQIGDDDGEVIWIALGNLEAIPA